MNDVREGKTTMWEKRANDSADQYAKMGASKHSLTEADVDLYRGFKSLAREAARWSGALEVHLQTVGKTRLDTVGLDASMHEAAPAAVECPPPAPAPDVGDDPGRDGSLVWSSSRAGRRHYDGRLG